MKHVLQATTDNICKAIAKAAETAILCNSKSGRNIDI
jgi:hypothetical protein